MTDAWGGYEAIGGHLVLDLVNTMSWRDDDARRSDRLADPAFRDLWLASVGLPPVETATELIGLRETVFELLTEPEPQPRTLNALRRRLLAARRMARLAAALPLRWELAAGEAAEHVLALAAEDLLRSADVERVRRCAGDGCGWLFLDRSRNGSRQWCSPTDCGNRARVRRHYSRRTRRRAEHRPPHP